MHASSPRKTRKARKGFSLVELVVVIIIIAILAVAVFAGGSAVIKKSQVSRTISDLHNFSIAIEAAVNETPSVANMKVASVSGADNDMTAILTAINNNLATDYKLKETAATAVDSGNLQIKLAETNASYVVLESTKTDAWGNSYYAILDFGERHEAGQSDFYVTVVSAGPNAQTVVGGAIESDDIFLLVQYSDGDVSSVTYNCASDTLITPVEAYTADNMKYTDMTGAGYLTTKGVAATTNAALYAGGLDNKDGRALFLPVNF
jgi:prepilin-type N-terminal cleavage/methylation domain-containing protein